MEEFLLGFVQIGGRGRREKHEEVSGGREKGIFGESLFFPLKNSIERDLKKSDDRTKSRKNS